MAWNEFRIWLAAPGCEASIEHMPLVANRETVDILSFELSAGPRNGSIEVVQLRPWFAASGMREDKVMKDTFRADEIEASIEQVEGTVRSVRLTFQIIDAFGKSKLSKAKVEQWYQFVSNLCSEWGFQIYNWEEERLLPCQEFVPLLRNHPVAGPMVKRLD